MPSAWSHSQLDVTLLSPPLSLFLFLSLGKFKANYFGESNNRRENIATHELIFIEPGQPTINETLRTQDCSNGSGFNFWRSSSTSSTMMNKSEGKQTNKQTGNGSPPGLLT